MDLASVIGLVVALGMILAGNAMEGGKIAQIAQLVASLKSGTVQPIQQ